VSCCRNVRAFRRIGVSACGKSPAQIVLVLVVVLVLESRFARRAWSTSIWAVEVIRYATDLIHALTIEDEGDDDDENENEDDCAGAWRGLLWRYPPSAVRIFVPSGLPKPVVASQPGPALKEPLFPETMSRKAVGFWYRAGLTKPTRDFPFCTNAWLIRAKRPA